VNTLKERIKGRKNFPTEEVDPDNYLSDDEVRNLKKNKETLKFVQEDYYKLYNCVHCGECDTEEERLLLKQRFLEDGNRVKGLDNMIESSRKYRTPYPSNKMRIRKPEGIPAESNTLLTNHLRCHLYYTIVRLIQYFYISFYSYHLILYLIKNKLHS